MSNKFIINFSSKNANKSSDSDSNFTTSFQSSKELNNVVSVKLNNMIFTNTVYNINSKNNVFYYSDSLGDQSVVLPVGQYSTSALLTALETALASAPNPIVANFDINLTTYKVSMVSAVPAIELYDRKNDIFNLLGYKMGLSGSSGLVASYTFPNIIDISGLDVVHVCSTALSLHGSIDNFTSSSTGQNVRSRTNVFKQIPVNSAYGFKVNYSNPKDLPDLVYDTPRSLANIDIQLRDNYGDVLELNGVEVYFSFEVEYLN